MLNLLESAAKYPSVVSFETTDFARPYRCEQVGDDDSEFDAHQAGPLRKVAHGVEIERPQRVKIFSLAIARWPAQAIVSDLSTTLWWAALLRWVAVVSLDLFGFEGEDQLRNCDRICCINNLREIAAIPDVASQKAAKWPARLGYE